MQRFTGGRTAFLAALVVGVLGLVGAIVGFLTSPAEAYHGYLVGFLYWAGISVGSLILISVFHVSGARWMVVLRRAMETMASASIIFAVLFIPIILGREHLFGRWLHIPHDVTEPWVHHLEGKTPYLNLPFFLIRAAIYFGVWIGVSFLLHKWSTRQDETGDLALTVKQRRLGTGSIPFLALTITFAAFDWIMSLEPLWQSTIFGVYYFAGSFLAAICVLTIATTYGTSKDAHGSLVTPAHFHNLGKLMLAFTAFWAYIAFSQLMLIWIANLPEEAEWYVHRISHGWQWWAYVLGLGHFVLPFFTLLSRDIKLKPKLLSLVAGWILLMNLLDLFWLVMPALHPHGPTFGSILWTLISFAGVGGLSIAFALSRARGRFAVPVRDPYLAESLRYVQP